MQGNPLQGIPAGGEGPYVVSSDLEATRRVVGEIVVGVAYCFDDPRGDSSGLDLLSVTWLIGYEQTFPALADVLGAGEVDLNSANHAVVGVDLKIGANERRKGLEGGRRVGGTLDSWRAQSWPRRGGPELR